MLVLSQPSNKATVIARNTPFSSNWGADSGIRQGNTAPVLPNGYTLPPIRLEKILTVRQQLAEDRYDLNKRLDAALDRLLENLVA